MRKAGHEGGRTSEQQAEGEEDDAVCVITTGLPVAGGGLGERPGACVV